MSSPLGVLGGIFDPVHNGHLAVASLAKDFFKLDKVLLIPSGVPPHKLSKVKASPSDRLEMLRLAIGGKTGFEICTEEINRQGYSYTFDTLNVLKKQYGNSQIYFIIGSDNLKEISTWYRYIEVIELVTLCVAHRPGYSCKIPEELKKAKILKFPSPEWAISSTMVRTYLHRGYSCRHLLPDPVIDYILSKGLYKKDTFPKLSS